MMMMMMMMTMTMLLLMMMMMMIGLKGIYYNFFATFSIYIIL